jgi:hypothetical protein
MSSHPYISGAGNITQIIGQLRKNFPSSVTSETVKKYGIASNNESYVINALQFIGAIDEGGKRTERGSAVFATHKEEDFQKAFESLIRDAYKDLFELHGDGVWTLSKEDLIGYFRTTDKTSDVIGTRQANVFRAFASLAGHSDTTVTTEAKVVLKPKQGLRRARVTTMEKAKPATVQVQEARGEGKPANRDVALTVRIEINLPGDGSRETYDNIFQSIKANLLNE